MAKLNAKNKVLNQLDELGETSLKDTLEHGNYKGFSYTVFLLFFKDFEMLLTFICGFVANLPISVLFNILTFSNVDFTNNAWVIYFVIYILCFISTIVLTVLSFAVTIKYVKIKSEKTIPDRIKKCIETNEKQSLLHYITCRCIWIIVSGLFFVLTIIALFIVNAFFLE